MDEGKRQRILEEANKDDDEQKEAAVILGIQQAKNAALKRKMNRFGKGNNNST